jgi:type IV pilus biogenesis protein CpaD/CtpE
MNSKARLIAVMATAGLLLSGCAAGGSNTGLGLGKADNFGEANRQTFAAMVINPNPEYDEPMAPGDGERAAQAIERLRTGKVKMPERQGLSEVGRTSGGGASAPSGGN